MRKAAGLLALGIALMLAPAAKAQVFYQYPTALPVEVMRITVGPYLGAGDELFRMGGYGRWGLASSLDIGFELLGERADGDGRFGAGIDMKLSLLPSIRALPFDLSASAGVGFISGDVVDILQFPIGGIVSIPLETESGRSIVPYVGVYLLIVEEEITTRGVSASDTDFDAEIRPGLSIGLSPDTEGFAAIHLGRDGLFTVGVNIRL